jgi:hypothetical protein
MPVLRKKRPSPALIVAILALIAALSGTAVAANKFGGGQIKRNAIKAKHIRDGNVTAPKLADGNVTEPKLAFDAKSYAKVSGPGLLSQSRGVVTVSRNVEGRYCFDLAFTANNAVATPDGTTPLGTTTQTQVPAAPGCVAPFTDATVFTVNANDQLANRPFFVQFD